MAVARGTRIGSYEIEAAIGAGGIGEVYRAKDTKLGRHEHIAAISGVEEDRVTGAAK